MADWPRWVEKLPSDFNLMSFLRWAQAQPVESLHDLTMLYIIDHITAAMRLAPARPDMAPTFMAGGLTFRLKTVPCTEVGCVRCQTKGGYRFGWFSPKWSCLSAVNLPADESRRKWAECQQNLGCSACRGLADLDRQRVATSVALASSV